MQVLRHSRISVTLEIYTDAASEATRDALNRLGHELGQPDGQAGEEDQDEPRE